MADLEGSYYQASFGGVDDQRVISGRRLKIGAGLLVGSCLLAGIVATSAFTPNLESNSGSSSLFALAKARSPGQAVTRSRQSQSPVRKLEMHGISPTPMAKLALAAIDANNRLRDISMRAESVGETEKTPLKTDTMDAVTAPMDRVTKDRLEKMGKEVALKAQDMAGVTAPLGFFDPLGFSTDCSTGKLLFYREVELKHGRVGMLASLGFLVGENFHPLFGGDIDVPAYIAFQQTPLQTFWGSVLAAIALPEVFSVFSFESPFGDPMDQRVGWWSIRSDHTPGDLGFDPLGLKPKDPKEFKEMQTKELNNGRLAMIATAGMIAQELATGQKIF
jgi:hypothetical protein